MIRLLTQEDDQLVRSYLEKDPLHNIYLIHGLQTHGLASEHVSFWGAFGDDRLEGVLFADNDCEPRFGSLVGESRRVLTSLGKLALRSGVSTLAGKSTYMQPLTENVPPRFVMTYTEHLYFFIVRPGELVPRYDYSVQAVTNADTPLLVELYKDCELGGRMPIEETEREIRRAIDKGGVYFVCEVEGRVVSGARIFPQTDRVGMIDGATTLPEFRGRRIYPCVRTACYEHLFKHGKIGVGLVNVTNAPMHKVIEKYGGHLADQWLIAVFRKKPPLRQRVLPKRLRRWGLQIRDRILRQQLRNVTA